MKNSRKINGFNSVVLELSWAIQFTLAYIVTEATGAPGFTAGVCDITGAVTYTIDRGRKSMTLHRKTVVDCLIVVTRDDGGRGIEQDKKQITDTIETVRAFFAPAKKEFG